MDNSSAANNAQIFDYPEPKVRAAQATSTAHSQILVLFDAWRNILNARLLAVLALVGALGIFGFTTSDPSSLRLWGCAGYSVGVLWPVIYLYLKRGE